MPDGGNNLRGTNSSDEGSRYGGDLCKEPFNSGVEVNERAKNSTLWPLRGPFGEEALGSVAPVSQRVRKVHVTWRWAGKGRSDRF